MINKFVKSLIIILYMSGRAWNFYKQTDLNLTMKKLIGWSKNIMVMKIFLLTFWLNF